MVSQEEGSMTLDGSPPSFEHRLMRNAGPRGRPGGGGNVLEGPRGPQTEASVIPGTLEKGGVGGP